MVKTLNFIMRHLKLLLTILLVFMLVSGFTIWNVGKENTVIKTNFLLDTLITVKVSGDDAQQAIQASMDRIREIEQLMSAHEAKSEIVAVNQKAHLEPVEVSEETFKVMRQGIYYGHITQGHFDITIKPIMKLWQFNSNKPTVPDQKKIDEVLTQIGYEHIFLDEANKTVTLALPNMGIDLGGIAKGYAGDEVVRILNEYGIDSAYADLGGDIVVVGQRKKEQNLWQSLRAKMSKGQTVVEAQDWRIGIQDPLRGRGLHMGVVQVSDASVVTSGPYERNFEYAGKAYHHIVNPYTGYPVKNGLISVTIVAKKCMDADALSTGVFVMGEQSGLALIETLPEVEAITINDNKEVRITSGLRGKFTISNDQYRLLKQ